MTGDAITARITCRAACKSDKGATAAPDDLSRKIYGSYQQFQAAITNWSDIAEHAVLGSRGIA